MPPAPRDSAPGLHHVWVNATGNWDYYLDEVDRLAWIRRLVRALERYDWRCLAFCQMTTHVHALLEVHDRSLPEGMRWLNREYSRDFNARHNRAGTFIRRRYGNRRIVHGHDLLGAYAYVALNPVHAGLCPRAEDWRWSSYATTVGIAADFAFVDASPVLAELAPSPSAAVAALRDFVAGRAAAAVSMSRVR